MSPAKHADDAPWHVDAVAHHQTDGHGGDHGHDDHAHDAADEFGPIDVAAWGAGIAGIAIAVVIAACFVLATSGLA